MLPMEEAFKVRYERIVLRILIIQEFLDGAPYNVKTHQNQWVLVRINMASVVRAGENLTNVSTPFIITVINGPGSFYVDNVRFVDSSVPSPDFNVTLHNVSDNSTANQLTWNGLTLPKAWVSADQYIQMDLDAVRRQLGRAALHEQHSRQRQSKIYGERKRHESCRLGGCSKPRADAAFGMAGRSPGHHFDCGGRSQQSCGSEFLFVAFC